MELSEIGAIDHADRLTRLYTGKRHFYGDIYHIPFEVGYSDRNAFMLANALLHDDERHLNLALDHTPESLLELEKRIAPEIQSYEI